MAEKPVCKIDGCDKGSYLKGMCSKHYQRVKKYGDPNATKRNEGRSCVIEGCDKPSESLRMCGMHYRRFQRHGDPNSHARIERHGCAIEGCDRDHLARGYCVVHYNRLLLHGDPLGGGHYRASNGEPMAWLLDHVDHDGDECLPWPYGRCSKGYAQVHLPDGRKVQATRVMCAEAHGEPIDPELQAAHSCGKGHEGCIHPGHLRWATVVENHADKIEHGTIIRGEAQHQAKLTADQVLEIRASAGVVSQADMARRFNIAPSAISKIIRRKAWAWL